MTNELRDLATRARNDTGFAQRLAADPAGELEKIAAQTQLPNTRVYWIIVAFVGAMGTMCLVGIIGLAALSKQTPEGLVPIASAIAGGLVGALVPTPKQ
jgi:hypothetical protein